MSLFVGDAGDSGISGNSSSSLLSSPSLGGAPRAADVRWRGLGASKGRILRDAILGGMFWAGGRSWRGGGRRRKGPYCNFVGTSRIRRGKKTVYCRDLLSSRKIQQGRYGIKIHLFFFVLLGLYSYISHERRNRVGTNDSSTRFPCRIIPLVGRGGRG